MLHIKTGENMLNYNKDTKYRNLLIKDMKDDESNPYIRLKCFSKHEFLKMSMESRKRRTGGVHSKVWLGRF